MSAEPTVTRCNFCRRLYKFYPFMAGDQSACSSCVAEAERNSSGGKSTYRTMFDDAVTAADDAIEREMKNKKAWPEDKQ